MNFNPPYPTVEPKTVCEDIKEYGSWMIVSDEVSEEKEDEIRRLQEKCILSEKNPFLIKPNPTPPPPSPLPPIPTPIPDPPFKTLDDKRYNKCMNHMSKEFKKLNKYCINPDRSPLKVNKVSDTFCTTGEYDMYCAQPNGFGMERVTGKCEEKKQLNFCGLPEKNKKLSCMPCDFDRTEFETDLHYGYLEKKCNFQCRDTYNTCRRECNRDDDECKDNCEHEFRICQDAQKKCKSKGFVPDKSDIYRQRVINRGFNDRWYSDIEILGDMSVGPSRGSKGDTTRTPSLEPPSCSDCNCKCDDLDNPCQDIHACILECAKQNQKGTEAQTPGGQSPTEKPVATGVDCHAYWSLVTAGNKYIKCEVSGSLGADGVTSIEMGTWNPSFDGSQQKVYESLPEDLEKIGYQPIVPDRFTKAKDIIPYKINKYLI